MLETLTYAVLLRLPNTLSREENAGHMERVISELGHTRCHNRRIDWGNTNINMAPVSNFTKFERLQKWYDDPNNIWDYENENHMQLEACYVYI